jgi:hypothetical protein
MSLLIRRDVIKPSGYPLGLDSAVDTFTDTDGASLVEHNPDGGGRWIFAINVGNSITGGALGVAKIDGGMVHNENTANLRIFYHSSIPVDADYDVLCDVILKSDNNLASAGPVARLDHLNNSGAYYFVRYNSNGNAWQLNYQASAGSTLLGSVAQDLTIDQSYRCTLRCKGTTISVIVDGVEIISVTDANIVAKGRAGIRVQQAMTSTTGVHLDNWTAVANNL